MDVIGVTGSVGKTSVKEMIGLILSQSINTLVTEGNLNNHIGVPLTLMKLRERHRLAVIEMGMNARGEIFKLSTLTKPTIAVITNAAPAHLEHLGSLEAIAEAKSEIMSGVQVNGTVVLNAEDDFFEYWVEKAGAHRVISFGLNDKADVGASFVEQDNRLAVDRSSNRRPRRQF